MLVIQSAKLFIIYFCLQCGNQIADFSRSIIFYGASTTYFAQFVFVRLLHGFSGSKSSSGRIEVHHFPSSLVHFEPYVIALLETYKMI